MRLFGDYEGKGLSHLEVLYQEGERELAVLFIELLGCSVIDTPQVNDTGTTYMIVHPEPEEEDPINNVFYLSQIRAPQRDLEAVLSERMSNDAELAGALATYRSRARTTPFGIPHFGIRFPSFDSIEPVLARLENITDEDLKQRVSVRVVRPDGEQSMSGNLIQAFVYTDLIANGFFCFGQLIELQAQNEPQAMSPH
jgi:hypothetical protein